MKRTVFSLKMISNFVDLIGGGLTQFLIEKPIITPFQTALTCSQLNGLSFYRNLKYLSQKNSLFQSLPISIMNIVPLTLSEQIALQLLSNKNEKKTGNIPFEKQVYANIISTIMCYPFTALEILKRTKCCSKVELKDIKYAIPRPLNFNFSSLGWNIARNISYLSSHSFISWKLQNISFGSNRVMKMNAISSAVGTIVSYPFDVFFVRSLHNYTTPLKPSIMYGGLFTELTINVGLSCAYGYIIDRHNENKSKRTFSFVAIKKMLLKW